MEAPAVPDRREEEGHGELRPEQNGGRVACRDADRVPGPEQDVVPAPAIVAQGDLTFGPAVDVVEDDVGRATAGQLSQVVDVDDTVEGTSKKWSHRGLFHRAYTTCTNL